MTIYPFGGGGHWRDGMYHGPQCGCRTCKPNPPTYPSPTTTWITPALPQFTQAEVAVLKKMIQDHTQRSLEPVETTSPVQDALKHLWVLVDELAADEKRSNKYVTGYYDAVEQVLSLIVEEQELHR